MCMLRCLFFFTQFLDVLDIDQKEADLRHGIQKLESNLKGPAINTEEARPSPEATLERIKRHIRARLATRQSAPLFTDMLKVQVCYDVIRNGIVFIFNNEQIHAHYTERLIYNISNINKYSFVIDFWRKSDKSAEISKTGVRPLSDIPMFYIKYLTTHKVHMYAGAIRQLLYSCVYVREKIHSLKLVDYPPVHTQKPYNNSHLNTKCFR